LVFVGKALKPFVVEDTLLKSCTNKRDYDKKKTTRSSTERKTATINQSKN
jgi:hypothetical protein